MYTSIANNVGINLIEASSGFCSFVSCFTHSQLQNSFSIYGHITNSQRDQLPVGLIAQLVEHCSGIAEVMGLNPVQARI